MDLTPLLTSRTVAAIGLACIVLSALAAFWGLIKLSYQRALGKPMPRNGLTMTLDVLAELATNVVGAVSRVLKLGTGEGLFRATVPLTPAEAVERQAATIARGRDTEPPGQQPGRVTLGALLVLLVVTAACPVVREGALVAARAPDPTDCRPGAGRCLETPDGPVPVVCSYVETPQGTHREWPSLPRDPRDGRQRTCQHGCEVTDAGVPHCTGLAVDGGAR